MGLKHFHQWHWAGIGLWRVYPSSQISGMWMGGMWMDHQDWNRKLSNHNDGFLEHVYSPEFHLPSSAVCLYVRNCACFVAYSLTWTILTGCWHMVSFWEIYPLSIHVSISLSLHLGLGLPILGLLRREKGPSSLPTLSLPPKVLFSLNNFSLSFLPPIFLADLLTTPHPNR